MKTAIAGTLGECVHVAGVMSFLRLAKAAGWHTVFLGPAASPAEMVEATRREKVDLVGVSYRLTPKTGEHLSGEPAMAAAICAMLLAAWAYEGTLEAVPLAIFVTGAGATAWLGIRMYRSVVPAPAGD